MLALNYIKMNYCLMERVLNVTSTGKTFQKIRSNILKAIKKINWKMVF